jgi:hypothetical protein
MLASWYVQYIILQNLSANNLLSFIDRCWSVRNGRAAAISHHISAHLALKDTIELS